MSIFMTEPILIDTEEKLVEVFGQPPSPEERELYLQVFREFMFPVDEVKIVRVDI